MDAHSLQVDAINTTQKIWINGVEESLSSSLNPPNFSYTMNQSGQLQTIGGAHGIQTELVIITILQKYIFLMVLNTRLVILHIPTLRQDNGDQKTVT